MSGEGEPPSKLALLVIDMQLALVTGAFRENEVLAAVQSVIKKARQAQSPIIFIQHNHASFAPLMKGATGWAIHPLLGPEEDDILIEKEASDAFYKTELENQLMKLGATAIAVTGMQTEYCVDTTCRSALSKDLDVVLVADGHTTGPSHLSASEIIEHHNRILASLAHPKAKLCAVASSDISFNDLSVFDNRL